MTKDIDARVACEIIGLTEGEPCGLHNCCLMHRLHPCEGCGRIAGKPKPYSTNLCAAFDAVEVVISKGCGFNLHSPCELSKFWMAVFWHPSIEKPVSREAKTPASAICLAALGMMEKICAG